ncbi:hypothetical protein [Stackebrandtia nassauensis]|uniref:Methyltransferase type 11 n=1 Tax=Stackebrandtia nassauensis (strain DSM 44728 / CIP 108903 / NRRL B-16338 / NBRC 102104 / LLR-40K-21) TaxID=446470 RepID=D3QBC8_STANL|nr:hypothetical protein [Stackebrandtia nassauensis]ADD40945.1 hypothetical protein Snas_1235 [Stackebrandtia nassauensis DSM 44728]
MAVSSSLSVPHSHPVLPIGQSDWPTVQAPGYRLVTPTRPSRQERFCGGFADRTDPEAVVIRPGYLDGSWTKTSWTDQGVRDKVGATHLPLPELLQAFLAAGLRFESFGEGAEPTPVVFAVTARKPR